MLKVPKIIVLVADAVLQLRDSVMGMWEDTWCRKKLGQQNPLHKVFSYVPLSIGEAVNVKQKVTYNLAFLT